MKKKLDTYEFCRIIDLLDLKAQILYIVEQDEDTEKYNLKASCYFPELGQISLTFGGFKKRKDAIETMMGQNIESSICIYHEFKKITEGNFELLES